MVRQTVYQGNVAHLDRFLWPLTPRLTRYFRDVNLFKQTVNLKLWGIIMIIPISLMHF